MTSIHTFSWISQKQPFVPDSFPSYSLCHIMQVRSQILSIQWFISTLNWNLTKCFTFCKCTVYFGGVSEFSSIFLALSTLFQYHPPSSLVPADSPKLPLLTALELFCQAMFVVTFFMFRIVGWVYTTIKFLIDCRYVMQKKLVSRYKPGTGWFLWYLITISIALSALQIFWFYQIVEKVKSMA